MKLSALSVLLAPASVFLLVGFTAAGSDEPSPIASGLAAPAAAAPVAPAALVVEPPREPPPQLGEPRLDPSTGRYVASLGSGRAILTIDPRLQARLEKTLASYAVPWGATVLLEPGTGRVLAMAEHSDAEPQRKGIATAAFAPAASVFKIVTAAALLEQGVRPGDEVCFHGGKHRLQPKLLADDPRRDRTCFSLATAFGHSANVVFAKLAERGLDPAVLRSTAGRFLFNGEIPFSRPIEMSRADFPADPFQLANTAAGFGAVKLSPLHAALLASIVANGGQFVPPALIESVEGASAPAPRTPVRVVDEGVAGALGEMMRSTCSEGTARRAFRRASGPLRGVSVAGKTGSLTDPTPYRDYTWFVGFAPADHPQVVVATLIVNGRLWRVRAPMVAKDALEAFFGTRVAATETSGPRTAKAPAP
jgi:cell division protein FtsI/penicillin-binding protein 2